MLKKIGILMIFFLISSTFQEICSQVQADESVSENSSTSRGTTENSAEITKDGQIITSNPTAKNSSKTESQFNNVEPIGEPLLRKVPLLSGNIVKLDDVFNPAVGNGVSYASDDIVILSDDRHQSGAIWAKQKLDLNKPFSLTFYLYLGSSKSDSGDGMTLTFQSKSSSWLGNAGENMGAYVQGEGPKKDLLALEFDTFYNRGTSGSDNLCNYLNHIAFRTSGSPYDPHYGVSESQNSNIELSNGKWKKVTVDYKVNSPGNGTMSYDFMDISQSGLPDGNERSSSVTFNYDGKGNLPAFNTSEVFWGFTSSTGDNWEENAVAFEALPQQGKIEATDSIIYVGQKWSPGDNYLSGIDSFGNMINVEDLQVYVDDILNGDLDTSKPGIHKVKYEYTEMINGLEDRTYSKEITVTVLQSTKVTAKPQVLRYVDTDSSKFDAKDFVEVKDENDNILSNYTAKFLSFPNSLDGTEAIVEVTDSNNQAFIVNVPVTYELGNSINLLGRDDDRVATFSLDDAGKNIIATYNAPNGDTFIHRDFSDVYYSLTHFWQKTIASGALNIQTPDYFFSAKGTDYLNKLNQFDGDRILGVSPGDVIKIHHEESGRRLQNYIDNTSEGNSPAKDMFYEVTTKGFKVLCLNLLVPSEQNIAYGTSEFEMDKNIKNYLNTEMYQNVEVDHFSAYPDTSKPGIQKGKIVVTETLSTGSKAQYEYEVPFVVNDPKLINVTLPSKMVFNVSPIDKTITSESYEIKNNGAADLDISLKDNSFVVKDSSGIELISETENAPISEEKMKLSLSLGEKKVSLIEQGMKEEYCTIPANGEIESKFSGKYFGEQYNKKLSFTLELRLG